jgi:hypothetical protein
MKREVGKIDERKKRRLVTEDRTQESKEANRTIAETSNNTLSDTVAAVLVGYQESTVPSVTATLHDDQNRFQRSEQQQQQQQQQQRLLQNDQHQRSLVAVAIEANNARTRLSAVTNLRQNANHSNVSSTAAMMNASPSIALNQHRHSGIGGLPQLQEGHFSHQHNVNNNNDSGWINPRLVRHADDVTTTNTATAYAGNGSLNRVRLAQQLLLQQQQQQLLNNHISSLNLQRFMSIGKARTHISLLHIARFWLKKNCR